MTTEHEVRTCRIPMSNAESEMPNVCISIVSHLHGDELFQLIEKIELLCVGTVRQVILTLNVPEPELLEKIGSHSWRFGVKVIENDKPKGFGDNHNSAFQLTLEKFFCVLNPDIDFDKDPFPDLINTFKDALTGCAFPVQLGKDGRIQDYIRQVPSPLALFTRHFGKRIIAREQGKPDWVNAAFMLYDAKIFRLLGGFDERYFMYCEDVDICLRLQLAGFKLSQSAAIVVHAAQRNTRKSLKHLKWHVTSLIRLWISPAYKKFYIHRAALRNKGS